MSATNTYGVVGPYRIIVDVGAVRCVETGIQRSLLRDVIADVQTAVLAIGHIWLIRRPKHR